MKRSVFNMALLFMLIFLVACSNDDNVGGNTDKRIVISNAELARVFDGDTDDKSVTISNASGIAGIIADEIIIKVTTGIFQNSNDVDVTFDITDDDYDKKSIAMTKSVKQVVNNILNVTGNNIEGLSKEASVVVEIDDTAVTATVTITVNTDYVFEDRTTTKTFAITFNRSNFDKIIISENAINIPAITVTANKAGINGFTIPQGFSDVTSGVNATFLNTTIQHAQKKTVFKNSITAIDISTVKGLKIKSVGDVVVNTGNTGAEIIVTFEPIAGYKFVTGTTKEVTINVSGDFNTVNNKIKEIAFKTSSYVEMKPGVAGISEAIQFSEGFIQQEGNSPTLTFYTEYDPAGKNTIAKIAVDKLFLNTLAKLNDGKFPDGVTYTTARPGEIAVTGTGATYTITLEALPGYTFQDGNAKSKKVEVKVSF